MDNSPLHSLLSQIKNYAAASDCEGCFPEQEFELLRNASLLDVTLPEQAFSFEKRRTRDLLHFLKLIGKASLPVGRIFEGHINALYLIHLFGTAEQQSRWYSDVTSDQKLFGVWNTEDKNGLLIHALGKGKFLLEGSKTFCSGAGWIERPLVTGRMASQTKNSWQMMVIPTEKVKKILSDGSFWKPLGMRASASFRMDFTGVIIDQEDFLGPADAYYQQPYFTGGAVRFAAVQLGGAEAVLEETHAFLRSVKRTEDAFQRARIAEIGFLVETGNLWITQAALKMDELHTTPAGINQLLAYVNMTRTMIEEICLRCMQLSEKSVGSRGLMRPHALERIHRDLTTYLRQPAPDATLTAIGEYILSQESTSKIWEKVEVKKAELVQ